MRFLSRAALVLLLALASMPALAQGGRFNDVIFQQPGVPAGGSLIRVCTLVATGTPCSPTASIYNDVGLTSPAANPITADINGNFGFWAAPGNYQLQVSRGTAAYSYNVTVASPGVPLGTAGQKLTVNQAGTTEIFQDSHPIDLRNCPGVTGDGVADDGAAINTCIAANQGKKFYAPQLLGLGVCTYYHSIPIVVPNGTSLMGDGAQFGGGGTVFCHPAGVRGVTVNQYAHLSDISVVGGSPAQLSSATLIIPSGDNLNARYQLAINTLVRATGVTTATLPVGARSWYAVNQIVKVTGVAEDATFNGTYYISAVDNSAVVRTISWAQAGAPDVGSFSPAAGLLDVATTGTATDDGIFLTNTGICPSCIGSSTQLDNVNVQNAGRDGIHFDHAKEQDDYTLTNVWTQENRGAGLFMQGSSQKNVTYHLLTYNNGLNGIFDTGFLGNSHYDPQASYNATGPGLPAGTAYNIATISRASGVITFTLASGSFVVGNGIKFAGVTDSSFNSPANTIGCYVATVVTGTYTCTQPGYNLANATSSGGTARTASASDLNKSIAGATGAYAIGLNNFAGNWTMTNPYDEGGQPANQYNAGVLVLNPHSGNGIAPEWPAGLFIGYPGGGAATTLKFGAGLSFKGTADQQVDVDWRVGTSADQILDWNILDYTGANTLTQFQWNPSGSTFSIYDQNYTTGIRRFGFDGTNGADGPTYVNARGANPVRLNYSTGTGGTIFYDGATNPVASVDSAGVIKGTAYKTTNLLVSGTAPTISSGFGSSPSIASNNGTAAFTVNVGTGGTASAGVIGLPTATTGWNCFVNNITASAGNAADQHTVQTASSTTTATIQNQTISTGAALAWTASDVIRVSCFAY